MEDHTTVHGLQNPLSIQGFFAVSLCVSRVQAMLPSQSMLAAELIQYMSEVARPRKTFRHNLRCAAVVP